MVIVITGATAGVGRATALEFARRDKAHIVLLGRGRTALEAARHEVEALGGAALSIETDMAHPDQVEAAAARTEAEFGPIDVWINNAMVSVFSPVADTTPAEYRRVTEVTYLGAVYGTLAALRRMRPRNRGVIVQVGSALAYRSIPLQSAYCAAKHALRGFTDSLRSELIHDECDIHLTMVHLPALNTPQFEWVKSKLPGEPQPVPPIFQPEVAARAIRWSVGHRRRELVVGFPTWKAIVGSKIIPGWIDRYLARFGYESQQTGVTADPNRPNNLFAPVDRDFGTHGRFDHRSRNYSLHYWFTTHRRALALASIGAVVATIGKWTMTRSSSGRDRTVSPQRAS